MHQLIKRLQIYKNALNTLKQRFVDMEIENLEDYNNEAFKIINGIIEYISLSVNRNVDNKEEKYLEVQKKKLEEEIKKKTKKLEESEEKFRLITENVNNLISVFDKNLNLIY